ncbi:CoA transferase [Corynebacterium appendicis]|uniref:CoA transferase n=1 Tax=Corynebacterium appendicis TaxID=163202 RepID=UPI000970837B|nr:CoA transferase [Corynebacterium appendicis]MCT1684487.1 CoA transferase [Corynebacterium appendicis]
MPPKRGDDGTHYLSIKRNKTLIKLNLKDSDDLDTAYAIIGRADVPIDNFGFARRPATKSRLRVHRRPLSSSGVTHDYSPHPPCHKSLIRAYRRDGHPNPRPEDDRHRRVRVGLGTAAGSRLHRCYSNQN